jgi:phospholipase/carboxylesterase
MFVADGRFAPVLLTHGSADEVLPAACLPAAEAALKALGVPVEAHLIPGLGHGIDATTLRLALAFAARCFPGQR